jgi:multidrug transporter EmrE-like cation transporter
MLRTAIQNGIQAVSSRNVFIILILIGANTFFNIVANASFKYSAMSLSWRSFLSWQVLGNLAGLITVITLTILLRTIPLYIAFPVTTGLAVIGVQVFASRLLFQEPISPVQWLGTGLVVVGILLIGGR